MTLGTYQCRIPGLNLFLWIDNKGAFAFAKTPRFNNLTLKL